MLLFLLVAFDTVAQTNNMLSDAEIEGRKLAKSLANMAVDGHSTNTGLMLIRDGKGNTSKIPVQFEVSANGSEWTTVYRTTSTGDITRDRNRFAWLTIFHALDRPNIYRIPNINPPPTETNEFIFETPDQIMTPFAGSDFWDADLALEFFHWPDQKIIKKEFSRGRGCMVLESMNPNPTNGYSKVDCWVDEESYGIVHAEAFDPKGKKLKEFDPKSFKKVNGQWQLQDMEIRNVQTGSRTTIHFDLKSS